MIKLKKEFILKHFLIKKNNIILSVQIIVIIIDIAISFILILLLKDSLPLDHVFKKLILFKNNSEGKYYGVISSL